jgi:hypothetical protein
MYEGVNDILKKSIIKYKSQIGLYKIIRKYLLLEILFLIFYPDCLHGKIKIAK